MGNIFSSLQQNLLGCGYWDVSRSDALLMAARLKPALILQNKGREIEKFEYQRKGGGEKIEKASA